MLIVGLSMLVNLPVIWTELLSLTCLRRRAGGDMDNSPFGAESRWSIFISAHHRPPPELKSKPNPPLVFLFPQYHPVDWRSLEVGKVATTRKVGDNEDGS